MSHRIHAEFRTSLEFDADTESLEILEERAWDKFASRDDDNVEYELSFGKVRSNKLRRMEN
mgnify:CR=1 FL=1